MKTRGLDRRLAGVHDTVRARPWITLQTVRRTVVRVAALRGVQESRNDDAGIAASFAGHAELNTHGYNILRVAERGHTPHTPESLYAPFRRQSVSDLNNERSRFAVAL